MSNNYIILRTTIQISYVNKIKIVNGHQSAMFQCESDFGVNVTITEQREQCQHLEDRSISATLERAARPVRLIDSNAHNASKYLATNASIGTCKPI